MTQRVLGFTGGERDTKRLERLRRVELDIQQEDDGALSSYVLAECVRLWADVVTVLGQFAVVGTGGNPSRSEIAEAQKEAAINRLEQAKIDGLIAKLGQVDLRDSSAMHDLALECVRTLDLQLSILTSADPSGATREPRIFLEADRAWADARPQITAWRSRSSVLQETLNALRLLDAVTDRTTPVIESVATAKQEAEAAGKELEELLAALTQARAERAQGELSEQFKTLAEREHTTSWWFRGVTLALALVAIVWTLFTPTGSDWPDVVAHLAVAALIGGSSAYTARLAAAHRSTGDWADSVRVQLNTFQDFLGVIDDKTARTRVYEEFGRRVLGAPPAVVSGDESGTMTTAQLMELANAIAAGRK